MSPLFLPRIVPLPPFDAASAASTSASSPGCCSFDAVADAEEALEAQVNGWEREREDGYASLEDGVFSLSRPFGNPLLRLLSLSLSRWGKEMNL
jgi:hypothetical protein